MSETEPTFDEFQLHTEWAATGEGWVRNPINGITIEILDYL
jgi:hypothetical protein